MPFEILGDFDRNQLFCAGSITKQLTTFVVLSLLADKQFDLNKILDDENFLDSICSNDASKSFLRLFQDKIIRSKFTIRDLCSFYTGLPYTFDPTDAAIESVDAGNPFKHHSLLDEKTFLNLCENNITPVTGNRNKFHYSEISIMFLGYIMEKIYGSPMEEHYKKFVVDKFNLSVSRLARTRPKEVLQKDLSNEYDYAAVAQQDHGYFCYGNGFYTTMNDLKTLLEGLNEDPVFRCMVDYKTARAADEDLMNGLATELRIASDDLIYGYEGLSFSGCTLWSYSTKLQKGYLIFGDSEEAGYDIIYEKFGYAGKFDNIPGFAKQIYSNFSSNYNNPNDTTTIPLEHQGNYRRVVINDTESKDICVLGNNFLKIRDPSDVTYELMYNNKKVHIKSDDTSPDSQIGLREAKSGNRYMFYNGSLYKKISSPENSSESKEANVNSLKK